MSEVQVKESYFWQQVKAGLSDAQTHLSRIENTAGTGISDVTACTRGIDIWIELKVFHDGRLNFRTSQRVWITLRSGVGGTVWILARNGDALRVYEPGAVLAAPHKVSADKKSFSISEKDLPPPVYECGKPFKWVDIREVLFRPPK